MYLHRWQEELDSTETVSCRSEDILKNIYIHTNTFIYFHIILMLKCIFLPCCRATVQSQICDFKHSTVKQQKYY